MRNYPIPSEFNDEDKWLKYFSKKSMVIICIMLGNLYALYRMLALVHLELVGVILGVLLGTLVVLFSMLPVPSENYLKGAGQTYDILLLKILYRRRRKVIYIKGYRKE